MLIETMTPIEVTSEILEDWSIVTKSFDRLVNDYDKERRRSKIDKGDIYSLPYEIKTKKKNTWIFIFSKAPSEDKYKGQSSINICSLVYYYSSIGLRVFKIMPKGGISVYNGHLFKRYNERMSLGLEKPLDIVKHFFINNGYFTSKVIPKNNKEFTISVCKEGLLLGELQEDRSFLVNKTFINKNLIRLDQNEAEEELIKSLQDEIETELNKVDFDKESYYYKADIIKGITG